MNDAPADTLTARLLDDRSKRPRLLSDCERLISDEVSAKGGLSGLAIKGAYKIVCAVKPGIITEVMDGLLDDFIRRLEPFYAQHRAAGGEPRAFSDVLGKRSSEVADALLGITDDRAKRSKHQTLKATYERLRPKGKEHVVEAMPRVGRTLGAHL